MAQPAEEPAQRSSGPVDKPGELLIWTNVAEGFEYDFNRWYDEEHMVERAAIGGFVFAHRYRALSGPRRYLALYQTVSIGVFTSEAYRQAFTRQTDWSVRNFQRMRDTQRRVNRVAPILGAGTGSALGLIELPAQSDIVRAAELLTSGAPIPGLLGARALDPDAALSTPLPGAAAPVLRPCIVLEATERGAVTCAADRIVGGLRLDPAAASLFVLIWSLRSADLRPPGVA